MGLTKSDSWTGKTTHDTVLNRFLLRSLCTHGFGLQYINLFFAQTAEYGSGIRCYLNHSDRPTLDIANLTKSIQQICKTPSFPLLYNSCKSTITPILHC